ncbi:MAG: hypothetical protein ACQEQV_06760 [Fibrobacterota bacterium]
MNIRHCLKKWVTQKLHYHTKGPHKDIFIFSNMRSGSTILMDMLLTEKKMKGVREPLHHNFNNPDFKQYIPAVRARYPELSSKEQQALPEYIRALLDNKLVKGTMLRNMFTRHHSVISNRSVVKFVIGNPWIDLLLSHFDVHGVFLFRHPIPASLSRVKNGWGHHFDAYLQSDVFRQRFLTDSAISEINRVKKDGSPLEVAVTSWCLENVSAFRQIVSNDLYVLTYEELVVSSERVVEDLVKRFNLTNTAAMLDRLQQPASKISTKLSAEATSEEIRRGNKEYMLKRWKKHVNDEEEKALMAIVEAFGIDAYRYGSFFPASKYLNFESDRRRDCRRE